jgi:hypothetical protein
MTQNVKRKNKSLDRGENIKETPFWRTLLVSVAAAHGRVCVIAVHGRGCVQI